MSTITIQQATFVRTGPSEPTLLARSAGFLDGWQAPVVRVILGFGERPVGVPCPPAVFAQPLDKRYVLVVLVADLDESDTTHRPLGFHVLVIPRRAYAQYWHNPFALAQRVTPDWQARSALPELAWPATHLPVRTVEQVRQVLRRVKGKPLAEDIPAEEQILETSPEDSESPALLGGAQVLVDGGKLVFHRPRPDTDLLRALWDLLPNSNRGELWPASFAFSNALGFDVVVVPRYAAEDFRGYTTEELAADYPEGKYEYSLQMAAENGDQHELSSLFERRSTRQTWRMAVILLIGVSLIVLVARPGPAPRRPPPARLFLATGAVGEMNQPLNVLPLVHLMNEEVWKETQQMHDNP